MILKDWQRQAFLGEDLRDAGERGMKSISHCTLSMRGKPDLLPAEATAEIFLTVSPIQLPCHQTSAVHLGLSAQGWQQVWLQGPAGYNTDQHLRSKYILLSVPSPRKERIWFEVLREQWQQFHHISQVIFWIKEVNDAICSPASQKERKKVMLLGKQGKDPKSAARGMKKRKLRRMGYICI